MPPVEAEPADTMRDALNEAFDANESSESEITDESSELEITDDEELAPVEEEITGGDDDGVALDDIPLEEAPPPESQAPASWTPTARESWGLIPAEIQQEISRREKDLQNSFNETAQARKLSQSFGQLVQPYQGMFQAQGVDVFTGINNTLQLAAQLQMGTPAQKAQACANIIQQFGVDITSLDDLLVGNAPTQQQLTPEFTQLQQQMGQMNQYMQNQQNQQTQQNQAEQNVINIETEAFIKKTPFAQDLRTTMADFMDMAEKNQQPKLTLQQAYERALGTRPDIQKIIQNRGDTTDNAEALLSAQDAAVSIPQNTGPAQGKVAPASMREALTDAWDEA